MLNRITTGQPQNSSVVVNQTNSISWSALYSFKLMAAKPSSGVELDKKKLLTGQPVNQPFGHRKAIQPIEENQRCVFPHLKNQTEAKTPATKAKRNAGLRQKTSFNKIQC